MNNILSQKESAIKRINHCIYFYFLVLIFEGCLRKWVLPSFQSILFFIRDPIVIYIYIIATRNNLWPSKSFLLKIGLFISFLSIVVLLFKFVLKSDDIRFLIYGLRNYYLYIPFPFIIFSTLEMETLRQILRSTLFLSVPISLLVFEQSLLPASDVLNSGINEGFIPLGGGVLRTQGTFTSIIGQSLYIALLWAILLSALTDGEAQFKIKVFTIRLFILPSIIMLLVSGSRTAFVLCLILLMSYTISTLLVTKSRITKERTIIGIIFFVFVIIIILSTGIVEHQLNTLLNRASGAASEYGGTVGADMFDRILFSFTSFLRVMNTAPLLGYGIGYGGNARAALGIKLPDEISARDVEEELARNMFELGPFLGMIFILYRLIFAAWIASSMLNSTRISGKILPVTLGSLAIYIFIVGFLTGNGVVGGFGWFIAGISAASSRLLLPIDPAR